jgi:L-lactate dehydrogenase complex protein LldF
VSGALVTPGRSVRERTAAAVADPDLQSALGNLDRRLRTGTDLARSRPDLRTAAAALRRRTMGALDEHLARLTEALEAAGVQVHTAPDADDAVDAVLAIAHRHGARRVVKSKSMATEEIGLAEALEAAGLEVVETDLGEHAVQVAGERPSHLITPVIHKTVGGVAAAFRARTGAAVPGEPEALTRWVRDRLRPHFAGADLSVTGANFAVAETGTLVIVTNEGNADLGMALAPVQVAVVPIEKVVPRLTDLAVLLPLLTRAATGQRCTSYVTLVTGPRRPGELDGPAELHVVLLDNGRRRLVGTRYEEMLACVRCGACLNACPVFRHVSGHAYDATYSGPMGAVLTPLLSGGRRGAELPWASTLCGACTDACPVAIPLADLLAHLRADLRGGDPVAPRPRRVRPRSLAAAVWARAWAQTRSYRATTAVAAHLGAAVRALGRRSGRALPVPAPVRFRDWWHSRSGGGGSAR